MSGLAREDCAKFRNRRVVTGLDAQGRSCVLFDGPPPQTTLSQQSGYATALLWRSNGACADEPPIEDAGAQTFSYRLEPAGSAFLMLRLPEATEEEAAAPGKPELHSSDRTDYIVVLEGEVTLVLEQGEVMLKAGDVVVDRGVAHAWRNPGSSPAVMAAVMVAGLPLEAAAP